MGLIVRLSKLSTFHAYQSTPTITGVLHVIEICTVSGLMILCSNGKAANPLIHRNELPAGIIGPQLFNR